MTDFEKQVPKEGYQEANLKYMGITEPAKQGETNGKKWRKAKLEFKFPNKDRNNKFVIWTPLTSSKSKFKSDTELKQLDTYYVGWFEKQQSYKDNEWVEKNIAIISDKSDTINNKALPSKSVAAVPTSNVPVIEYQTFMTWYKAKYEFKDISKFHAIGAFLCANLKKGCELTLTTKIKEDFQDVYDKNIDKSVGTLLQS